MYVKQEIINVYLQIHMCGKLIYICYVIPRQMASLSWSSSSPSAISEVGVVATLVREGKWSLSTLVRGFEEAIED